MKIDSNDYLWVESFCSKNVPQLWLFEIRINCMDLCWCIFYCAWKSIMNSKSTHQTIYRTQIVNTLVTQTVCMIDRADCSLMWKLRCVYMRRFYIPPPPSEYASVCLVCTRVKAQFVAWTINAIRKCLLKRRNVVILLDFPMAKLIWLVNNAIMLMTIRHFRIDFQPK